MDNRGVIERLAECVVHKDLEAVAALLHPDVVVKFPQSGEVFRGKDNYLAMLASYPHGLPDAEVAEERGGQQTVHVSSPIPFGMPTITVTESGDTFILEGDVGPYPDGVVYKFVGVGVLRDGLLIEETDYFAAPFEAPEWRHPFSE